jgi:hypothetical protein
VKDYWDRYRRGLMRPGPRGDVAEEGVVI